MRLTPPNPLHKFTLVSFAFAVLIIAVTGVVLTGFFRQAAIEREGVLIRHFVQARTAEMAVSTDLEHFGAAESQERLEHNFSIFSQLAEAVRIKIFNRHGQLAWSDNPELVGIRARREGKVSRALTGSPGVVFYRGDEAARKHPDLPPIPLVEFYVPIKIKTEPGGSPEIGGVMALYRSGESLDRTIDRGVYLAWTVLIVGGVSLYLLQLGYFRTLLRRTREAEDRLSRLGAEHERIVQMEKLSAVGQLVGEIAHQINNPLVGVTNLAQLAEREEGIPPRTRQLLAEIRQAGEHCGGFVRRMLDFTRIAQCRHQRADLVEVVSETVRLFDESGGNARVVSDLPDTPLFAEIDPVLMRHAIFNLIKNASEVTAAGDEVRVTISGDASGYRIEVRDRGPGIPLEVMDRIFTPFFTTRASGTGLGLSVAEQIVTCHLGRITATNLPDGGACFTVHLPPSPEQG